MIRTQIQLEARQERAIKRIARRDGISMAEAIRRCVDEAIALDEGNDRATLYKRAAELIGALSGSDGLTNVSSNHDEHLDEAYE